VPEIEEVKWRELCNKELNIFIILRWLNRRFRYVGHVGDMNKLHEELENLFKRECFKH
jgi:hypothetical protein